MSNFKPSLLKGMRARTGFSLIELVVVISIIALMSAAVYSNYSAIDNRGKLLSVASKTKEDLNLAQTYSLGGKANGAGSGPKNVFTKGWGVYFNRNSNKYVVFSDLNGNGLYDYPTKLLIHGNETVAAGTFTDSSMLANVVTVDHATQVASPGRPVGTSGYWVFNGISNNLQVPYNTAYDVAAEDFAIDFWFKASSTGSQKALFYKGNGAGTQTFAIYKDATDKMNVTVYDTGGVAYTMAQISGRATIDTNWHHFALGRVGNTMAMFIDGTAYGKVWVKNLTVRTQNASIYIGSDDSKANGWDGLIDEIRFSRGNGRWIQYFNTPGAAYGNDDENFKEIKLPPGIVFERLYADTTAVNELNVYFNPTTYYLWVNGAVATDSAKIKFNNAGAENTGSTIDSPKFLKVMPSGLVKWSAN